MCGACKYVVSCANGQRVPSLVARGGVGVRGIGGEEATLESHGGAARHVSCAVHDGHAALSQLRDVGQWEEEEGGWQRAEGWGVEQSG